MSAGPGFRVDIEPEPFATLLALVGEVSLPEEFIPAPSAHTGDGGRRRVEGLLRLARLGLVLPEEHAGTVRPDPTVVSTLRAQAAPEVGVQVRGWSGEVDLVAAVAVTQARGSALVRVCSPGRQGGPVQLSALAGSEVVAEVARYVGALGQRVPRGSGRLPVLVDLDGAVPVPGSAGLLGGARAGLHLLVTAAAAPASAWCEEWLADATGWWRLRLQDAGGCGARHGRASVLRLEPVDEHDLTRTLAFTLAGLLGPVPGA